VTKAGLGDRRTLLRRAAIPVRRCGGIARRGPCRGKQQYCNIDLLSGDALFHGLFEPFRGFTQISRDVPYPRGLKAPDRTLCLGVPASAATRYHFADLRDEDSAANLLGAASLAMVSPTLRR